MAERWFPIQLQHRSHARLRVPWRVAEKAYAVYARHFGTEQSCERLAERGGFGLEEFIYLLAGENPFEAKEGPFQTDSWGEFPEDAHHAH